VPGEVSISGRIPMIKFDEEIKSYKKSLEIGESADAIYNQDFTDMADVVLGIMKDDKKSAKKPSSSHHA
jgi:hypothetical protein